MHVYFSCMYLPGAMRHQLLWSIMKRAMNGDHIGNVKKLHSSVFETLKNLQFLTRKVSSHWAENLLFFAWTGELRYSDRAAHPRQAAPLVLCFPWPGIVRIVDLTRSSVQQDSIFMKKSSRFYQSQGIENIYRSLVRDERCQVHPPKYHAWLEKTHGSL